MLDFPPPTSVTELRRFLGVASFYRRFVRDFATISHPLTALLRKGVEFLWAGEQQAAFEELVGQLCAGPVLAHPDPNAELFLNTDASCRGLGAVLAQRDEAQSERVICYVSRALTGAEAKWHSNDLECLAVVWAVTKLRPYIYGRAVTVRTDSTVARALLKKKELTGKYARWVAVLADYDPLLKFEHCRGTANVVADALSRASLTTDSLDGSTATRSPGLVLAALHEVRDAGSFSVEELAVHQERDAIFGPLVRGAGNSSGVRGEFSMRDGILCRRNSGRGRAWLVVVPGTLRFSVTSDCHGGRSGGHEGEAKTRCRVGERFWWPGLRQYVRRFVRGCSYCQARKIPRTSPRGRLLPIPPPSLPFQCWGIDHLGPLSETDSGALHVIVAIDYFTKYVVAEAVPDTGANAAVRFLLDRIAFVFGVPRRVVTDQGPAFTSFKWAGVVRHFAIEHALVSAEHAQANGLVERANGTLVDRLCGLLRGATEDWGDRLQQAVFSINTGLQATTGVSPFELVFGLTAVLPIDSRLKRSGEGRQVWDAREGVRDRILRAQAKQKEQYDRQHRGDAEFRDGELVLVRRLAVKRGVPAKFQRRYVGPYVIYRRVSPVSYQVADLPCNRGPNRFVIFSAHVSQLKPWTPPVAPGEDDPPCPLALSDENETDVEGYDALMGDDEPGRGESSAAPAGDDRDGREGDAALTDDESEAEVSNLFPRLADEHDLAAPDDIQPAAENSRPRRIRRLPVALADYDLS